jgi:hypothetical protein
VKNRLFRNKRWVPALLAAALLGLSSAASARDYYVDAREGSDANEGSQQRPFRTLTPLLARLTPCDNAYMKIDGAANGNGVGRYSHAELPTSAVCTAPTRRS